MATTVTFNSFNLSSSYGFTLRSITRNAAEYAIGGWRVPGYDGIVGSLVVSEDRGPMALQMQGWALPASMPGIRAALLGNTTFSTLAISDQSPKTYLARALTCSDSQSWDKPGWADVTISFIVSPPCLLGTPVTDTTSPVANAGDYRCPAEWTVEASGAFTLTVGTCVGTYSGGAGTVVINSETFRVTLEGTECPQFWTGGFPWLAVGDNTVTCTPGFSCVFTPRYA